MDIDRVDLTLIGDRVLLLDHERMQSVIVKLLHIQKFHCIQIWMILHFQGC
ncbi:hypothetical protein V6Z11_A12G065800 [Gossypium hirsutum]